MSGATAGVKPIIKDVKEAKRAVGGAIPIIIGSGFSVDNAIELMKYADWAIVGNSVKTKGRVSKEKVQRLMNLIGQLSS